MPNKKLVIYIMYPNGKGDHPFLVMRRTTQNAKGRYITAEEILKLGVLWPTVVAKTREELALLIGHAVIDEVLPPTYRIPGVGLQSQLRQFRQTMLSQAGEEEEREDCGDDGPDEEDEESQEML